jgi:hypothetical protein
VIERTPLCVSSIDPIASSRAAQNATPTLTV